MANIKSAASKSDIYLHACVKADPRSDPIFNYFFKIWWPVKKNVYFKNADFETSHIVIFNC